MLFKLDSITKSKKHYNVDFTHNFVIGHDNDELRSIKLINLTDYSIVLQKSEETKYFYMTKYSSKEGIILGESTTTRPRKKRFHLVKPTNGETIKSFEDHYETQSDGTSFSCSGTTSKSLVNLFIKKNYKKGLKEYFLGDPMNGEVLKDFTPELVAAHFPVHDLTTSLYGDYVFGDYVALSHWEDCYGPKCRAFLYNVKTEKSRIVDKDVELKEGIFYRLTSVMSNGATLFESISNFQEFVLITADDEVKVLYDKKDNYKRGLGLYHLRGNLEQIEIIIIKNDGVTLDIFDLDGNLQESTPLDLPREIMYRLGDCAHIAIEHKGHYLFSDFKGTGYLLERETLEVNTFSHPSALKIDELDDSGFLFGTIEDEYIFGYFSLSGESPENFELLQKNLGWRKPIAL